MMIRTVLALGLLCAGCDKKQDDAAPKSDPPNAAGGAVTDEPVGMATGSGSAIAAADPWAGPPPGANTKAGADCGPKLNQIDPWAGSSTPASLPDKVDLAKLDRPVADKVELKDFGKVTSTGFTVTYNPGKSTNHETYRQLFVDNKLFDQVAEGLNRTVRMPKDIGINTVSCGTINAFYDPMTKRIIVCYELLDYFLGIFKPDAKSEAQLGNAVMGATMFGFFHELGHGLIDVLDLAAVGREEDSVDQLATLILIASGDEGVSMALAGAHWFKLQAKGGHTTPFWDEHAFDEQRFYNITCLIFGSDPKKHAELLQTGTLPMNRAMRCPDEYAKIKKAWEKLLQPHLTNGAAINIAYAPMVSAKEAPTTTATTAADPWSAEAPVVPAVPASDIAPSAITCEQVADKAMELIGAEAEMRAKNMTPEELRELEVKLETELPGAREKILAACASEDWKDDARKCVLDAKTLAQATKCN